MSLQTPIQRQTSGRPPSPLRNGFIPDTSTGIAPDFDDDDNDESWQMRSPSPASSVSQLAVNLAQKVGSFVGMTPSRSLTALPTDAELEAEAERERYKSRLEAERILNREAMERRLVEDRVLEMLDKSERELPPSPSPASSTSRDGSPGWWAAAKNRLTSKEKDKDLTPAQQVIQETKAKEKEKKKTNTIRPVSQPSSPSAPRHSLPPNLTPSPRRNTEPSEPLPIYAHFDPHGTLDVHVTVLTIAKRFEKLEKWTVGHVRALEERMNDVERWLVEKENQVQPDQAQNQTPSKEIDDIRDELNELSSRMGELGREMARMATAPANLSSGPSQQSAEISVSNHQATKSSSAEHELGYISDDANAFFTSPTSPKGEPFKPASTARHSTSPPLASHTKFSSASRLPYPSGDYASPPSTSPTSSLRQSSISGLPMPGGSGLGLSIAASSSSYSLPGSPGAGQASNTISSPPAGRPLPTPNRYSSVSPSPTPKSRKRYTVALGGSIAPPEQETPHTVAEEPEDFGDETIGKKGASAAIAAVRSLSSSPFSQQAQLARNATPPPHNPNPRVRAQSTYGTTGSPNLQRPQTPTTAPLRVRSKSSERLFSNASANANGNGGANANKFVDPLVLRRQQDVRNATGLTLPKTPGKLPVEALVKFFDGDRKK